MYKLKNEYKGCTVSTGGYAILLDNVKSEQVENLGLKNYFTKTNKKAVSTKDK
tara:strand:- start:323 stop:481 length:159 start_codon:yes stop_codon:yes gene_type:complete